MGCLIRQRIFKTLALVTAVTSLSLVLMSCEKKTPPPAIRPRTLSICEGAGPAPASPDDCKSCPTENGRRICCNKTPNPAGCMANANQRPGADPSTIMSYVPYALIELLDNSGLRPELDSFLDTRTQNEMDYIARSLSLVTGAQWAAIYSEAANSVAEYTVVLSNWATAWNLDVNNESHRHVVYFGWFDAYFGARFTNVGGAQVGSEPNDPTVTAIRK